MLVDAPAALVATATRSFACEPIAASRDRRGLGGHVIAALARHDLAVGVALGRIVGHVLGQMVERELLTAVLAEEADRVRAALPAMAHLLGAVGELVPEAPSAPRSSARAGR